MMPTRLDTGSSLALELYPWAVGQLGLEQQKEEAMASSVVGARGEAAKLPVVFAEKERDDREREGGNIGNALLRHFLLTLDCRYGEIRLEPEQQ